MTAREATALAEWIALHERRLTTIYITHGHGDHFLGLSVILDRFPNARAVATAGRFSRCANRRRLKSWKRYRTRFPGQIADTVALAEPLEEAYFEVEGRPLHVIETGHTDTLDTTALYVPDLGLIASGDVAYNHCHMYVGATTTESRADWIAALDRLAALNPAAVVTGHKDPTLRQSPLGTDRVPRLPRILRTAPRERPADQELFDAMVTPLSRLGQPPGVPDLTYPAPLLRLAAMPCISTSRRPE